METLTSIPIYRDIVIVCHIVAVFGRNSQQEFCVFLVNSIAGTASARRHRLCGVVAAATQGTSTLFSVSCWSH